VEGVAAVTWSDVGETSSALAVRARLSARAMDQRRAALSRSALVWWQGEAAESYQHRVQDRVNALAALSARLDGLARLADEVAAAAALLEATERLKAPERLGAASRPALGSGGWR
jgi:uncharacterized protein YukE